MTMLATALMVSQEFRNTNQLADQVVDSVLFPTWHRPYLALFEVLTS